MKKYLWQIFGVALLITILASCGDEKAQPYDPNYIAGNYEGTCNIEFGNKKQTDNSFSARFLMNSSNDAALIGSLGDERTRDECGLGLIGNIQLTNIEKHGYATFRMSSITVTYSNLIPDFVNKQTDSFTVKSAKLTLTCEKGGQFDSNKQEISFVYKGKLEISGTQSAEKFSNSISYSFVLTKKR